MKKNISVLEKMEVDVSEIEKKIDVSCDLFSKGLFINCSMFLTEEERKYICELSGELKERLSFINQSIPSSQKKQIKVTASNITGYYHDIMDAYLLEYLLKDSQLRLDNAVDASEGSFKFFENNFIKESTRSQSMIMLANKKSKAKEAKKIIDDIIEGRYIVKVKNK
jgi:hypothetical protein